MEQNQEYISTDEAIAEIIFNTSYTIDHFYKFSIFQGGLTKEQFQFLYDAYQSKLSREYEFQAALHGVSFKGGSKSKKKDVQSDNPNIPLFGDPEQYATLSAEERENLTQKMLNKHKAWAENPFIKSK